VQGLPEGSSGTLAVGTGSGPEGSSLTADYRRSWGCGAEKAGGATQRGSRASTPAGLALFMGD